MKRGRPVGYRKLDKFDHQYQVRLNKIQYDFIYQENKPSAVIRNLINKEIEKNNY